MLSRMTPRQFDEFYALEQLEGIGSERDDRRARHLVAQLLRSQGVDCSPGDDFLDDKPYRRTGDGLDSDEGCSPEDSDAAVIAAFGGG